MRHIDVLGIELGRVASVVLERDGHSVDLVDVPVVVDGVLEVVPRKGVSRRGRGGVGRDLSRLADDLDQAGVASELEQGLAGLLEQLLLGLLLGELATELGALRGRGARRIDRRRRAVRDAGVETRDRCDREDGHLGNELVSHLLSLPPTSTDGATW